jgi:putative N6-adenine-specific DNA methylase
LENRKYIAKTFAGLEQALEQELNAIGIYDCEILKRSVAFECSFEHLILANLMLRTALRIYMPIDTFEVSIELDVYQNVYNFPWEEWIGLDQTFMIESIVNSATFRNSHFIGLKTKDAIADRFQKRFKRRPNVDIKNPDFRIQIHISSLNKCTLSFDTSGEALYKRGYKNRQTEASINECLAAGMIILSGWDGNSDFYNPMCGSGTILVEAAMIASKTPPNRLRKNWGFMKFKAYDQEVFLKIKAMTESQMISSPINFYASDNQSAALDIAKMNFFDAKLDIPFIHFSKDNFFSINSESTSGIMIINPPYNERLELLQEDLFYKDMGDVFKNRFKGFDIWLISSNKPALRKIGLKTETRFQLMNGSLPCEYCHYKIF